MIGGVEVVGQREGAVAVAVVGVVAGRRYDPVVPADVAKVDVERLPAAIVPAALPLVLLLGGPFTPRPRFPVVRVRHQERLLTSPPEIQLLLLLLLVFFVFVAFTNG